MRLKLRFEFKHEFEHDMDCFWQNDQKENCSSMSLDCAFECLAYLLGTTPVMDWLVHYTWFWTVSVMAIISCKLWTILGLWWTWKL